MTCAIWPSARRQDQAFAGLGGKILGEGKLPRRRRKTLADRLPGRLGGESDGDRGGRGRGLEYGMHVVLGFNGGGGRLRPDRACRFFGRGQSPSVSYHVVDHDHFRPGNDVSRVWNE